jgi:hypothetical protein
MLQAMQQPAEIPPSPTFAGLLASLAAPAREPASTWSDERADDGLEDDFATLSYERALRAHARYRPAHLTDESLTQATTHLQEPEAETPAPRAMCERGGMVADPLAGPFG